MLFTYINFDRKTDNLIEARVRERIPIVGIANPADILYRSVIPKVEVPNEHWYQVIEMIAERARVIVILFSQFSAGLSAELTVLSKLGRRDSTVIVVQEVNGWISKYARRAAEEKDFESLEWDSVSARLSAYGTVIREDEIETRLSGIIDDMLAAH